MKRDTFLVDLAIAKAQEYERGLREGTLQERKRTRKRLESLLATIDKRLSELEPSGNG